MLSRFAKLTRVCGTSAHSVFARGHHKMPKQELSMREIFLKYTCNGVTFPVSSFFGFLTVKKGYNTVITNFGKYHRTVPEGLHWRAPIFADQQSVFVGRQTHDMQDSKTPDANNNPVIVSGVVNYSIRYPEEYVFNIGSDEEYLPSQAELVLKRVVSQYPYESNDGRCLTKEGDEISEIMRDQLQEKVNIAGIEIHDFNLTDVYYSSEISQAMLIRQRAQAYIDAKATIGNAATDIVKDIVKAVESDVTLSQEAKEKLIVNLTTVITSETGAAPVLNLNK